jgi:hypothetical protein
MMVVLRLRPLVSPEQGRFSRGSTLGILANDTSNKSTYCRKLRCEVQSCDMLAFSVLKANLNISPSKKSFHISPSS